MHHFNVLKNIWANIGPATYAPSACSTTANVTAHWPFNSATSLTSRTETIQGSPIVLTEDTSGGAITYHSTYTATLNQATPLGPNENKGLIKVPAGSFLYSDSFDNSANTYLDDYAVIDLWFRPEGIRVSNLKRTDEEIEAVRDFTYVDGRAPRGFGVSQAIFCLSESGTTFGNYLYLGIADNSNHLALVQGVNEAYPAAIHFNTAKLKDKEWNHIALAINPAGILLILNGEIHSGTVPVDLLISAVSNSFYINFSAQIDVVTLGAARTNDNGTASTIYTTKHMKHNFSISEFRISDFPGIVTDQDNMALCMVREYHGLINKPLGDKYSDMILKTNHPMLYYPLDGIDGMPRLIDYASGYVAGVIAIPSYGLEYDEDMFQHNFGTNGYSIDLANKYVIKLQAGIFNDLAYFNRLRTLGSIEFWFKSGDNTQSHIIFSLVAFALSCVAVLSNGSISLYTADWRYVSYDPGSMAPAIDILDDAWHHIAILANPGGDSSYHPKIIIDGVKLNDGTYYSASTNYGELNLTLNPTIMYLGYNTYYTLATGALSSFGDYKCNGSIADFALYGTSYSLTEGQIDSDYLATQDQTPMLHKNNQAATCSAVWENPPEAGITLSSDNKSALLTSSSYVKSAVGYSSGKWYFEVNISANNMSNMFLGIVPDRFYNANILNTINNSALIGASKLLIYPSYSGTSYDELALYSNKGNPTTSCEANLLSIMQESYKFVTIGIALDFDINKVSFFLNGKFSSSTAISNCKYYILCGNGTSRTVFTIPDKLQYYTEIYTGGNEAFKQEYNYNLFAVWGSSAQDPLIKYTFNQYVTLLKPKQFYKLNSDLTNNSEYSYSDATAIIGTGDEPIPDTVAKPLVRGDTNSYYFNGLDCLKIPSILDSLDYDHADFTVVFWLNSQQPSTNNKEFLFSFKDTTNGFSASHLTFNNILLMDVYPSSVDPVGFYTHTNRTYMYTFIKSNRTIYFRRYNAEVFDGQPSVSSALTGATTLGSDMSIGGSLSAIVGVNNYKFTGNLSNFMVFDRLLSITEIDNIYNYGKIKEEFTGTYDELVHSYDVSHYWRFIEAASGSDVNQVGDVIVKDYVPHFLDLFYQGAGSTITKGSNLLSDGSSVTPTKFDNLKASWHSNYGRFDNSPQIAGDYPHYGVKTGYSYTITFLVKFTDVTTTTHQPIWCDGDTTNQGVEIGLYGGKLGVTYYKNGTTSVSSRSGSNAVINTTYFAAVTVKGAGAVGNRLVNIYIGDSVSLTNVGEQDMGTTGSIGGSAQSLAIGKLSSTTSPAHGGTPAGSAYLIGYLQELAVFDGILTTTEITALYNETGI